MDNSNANFEYLWHFIVYFVTLVTLFFCVTYFKAFQHGTVNILLILYDSFSQKQNKCRTEKGEKNNGSNKNDKNIKLFKVSLRPGIKV